MKSVNTTGNCEVVLQIDNCEVVLQGVTRVITPYQADLVRSKTTRQSEK